LSFAKRIEARKSYFLRTGRNAFPEHFLQDTLPWIIFMFGAFILDLHALQMNTLRINLASASGNLTIVLSPMMI